MYYTIYKTTNYINNKIYIGKHQTMRLDDDYLGSGKFIELAIKKYGRENFGKEILFIFDNENEMNEKEKELVTESFISSNSNYNAGIGGEGGAQFKGKSHSKETRDKISNTLTGRKHTDEERKKISESQIGRILSDETKEKIAVKMRNRSEETRARVAESLRRYHEERRRKRNIAGCSSGS